MRFEMACKKAMEYFKKEYGDVGFCSIKDLGEKWLFDGTDADKTVVYGKPGITIDKKNGEQNFFFLPDIENFKLLDKAINIEIPIEYRI